MPDLVLPHTWPELHDEIGRALVKIEENVEFIAERCETEEMTPIETAGHLRDLESSVRRARMARHA